MELEQQAAPRLRQRVKTDARRSKPDDRGAPRAGKVTVGKEPEGVKGHLGPLDRRPRDVTFNEVGAHSFRVEMPEHAAGAAAKSRSRFPAKDQSGGKIRENQLESVIQSAR